MKRWGFLGFIEVGNCCGLCFIIMFVNKLLEDNFIFYNILFLFFEFFFMLFRRLVYGDY